MCRFADIVGVTKEGKIMEKLNMNIRNFRQFRGITQQEMARRLGKSKNVISNWERGDNSPNPDEIVKLCEILEVTPNQIFGWDPLPEYVQYLHEQEKNKKELDEKTAQRERIRAQLAEIDREIAELRSIKGY